MEQEHFLSGYCRTADQTRIVVAVTEDVRLLDVDCCYERCPHTSSCTIAQQLRQLTGK
ncbi:MAG: hypothetical protein IJO04_03045 [Oscillospiraceae bacterium]|nr:hypothetical protein [Oscillospiraceae bacterium]